MRRYGEDDWRLIGDIRYSVYLHIYFTYTSYSDIPDWKAVRYRRDSSVRKKNLKDQDRSSKKRREIEKGNVKDYEKTWLFLSFCLKTWISARYAI